jgi:hypothetical protein
MFVSDIIQDAKRVFGICDTGILFGRITEAVDILSSHGDFDPLLGYADICTDGLFLSLPREVETLMAVNIGGRPALARDQLFTFHYNGPGDNTGWYSDCNLSWQDLGKHPTFRDLKCPSKIIAFVDNMDDEGKEVWVYGLDDQGREVTTLIGGERKRGYLVPTVFGYALPASDAPAFSKVTAIRKADTSESIRVSSFDNSTFTGTLLAVLDWDDNESQYRRVKLSRNCGGWVRVFFRRRVFKIRSVDDPIPVMSKTALVMMFRALFAYDNQSLGEGEGYEATAARLETQKQLTTNPPTQTPIMVDDNVAVQDKADWVD